MERKKIDTNKHLAVLFLTALIFIIGIYVGNVMSDRKLDNLSTFSEIVKRDTLALEIQYLLFSEEPCKSINSTPLTEELYLLSEKLDYMENRLGKDDEDVLRLKNYYSLLELRHWLFMKKTRKECNTDDVLVLYFYSNKKDCPRCEEQGFILTWLRRNYPFVKIYSFDINIENSAINTVKEMYDIHTAPTIVIEEETHSRFMTKNELKDIVQEVRS